MRRHVVVRAILEAKASGHRAYQNIHEEKLKKRAVKLPVDGVPKELVRLLRHDRDIDKVQI